MVRCGSHRCRDATRDRRNPDQPDSPPCRGPVLRGSRVRGRRFVRVIDRLTIVGLVNRTLEALNRRMLERMRTMTARRALRAARERGQSLVEFAIVLPVLFALVGVVIDASRVYLAWSSLESATRDAAQYLATSDKDPYSADYTWPGSDADAKADYILEATTGETFATSPTNGTLTDCTTAQVTTVYSTDASWQG